MQIGLQLKLCSQSEWSPQPDSQTQQTADAFQLIDLKCSAGMARICAAQTRSRQGGYTRLPSTKRWSKSYYWLNLFSWSLLPWVNALCFTESLNSLSCMFWTVAVFIIDESCLRNYVQFAGRVDDVLNQWGLGVSGINAYRKNFCARALTIEFMNVWVLLLLISAFVDPAVRLVKSQPSFKALQVTNTVRTVTGSL